MARPSFRSGFTLIELLVVISIIAILVGLTAASVQRVRAAAARARCANNMRQIGLALHHYHDSQKSFPPGVSDKNGTTRWLSWRGYILPYVEQDAVWRTTMSAYKTDNNPFHNPPHTSCATIIPAFLCPMDLHASTTRKYASYGPMAFSSYLGVEGHFALAYDGALFHKSRIRIADIRDGASNTLLLGERPSSPEGRFGWWYAGCGQRVWSDGSADAVLPVREINQLVSGCPFGPYRYEAGNLNNPCDALHYWSVHPGGAHFAFADGSVRLLAYSADSIMPALATREGGEAVSPP